MVLLELDPAAGRQIAPNLRHQRAPVPHPDRYRARVDVVEGLVEDPRRGDVVDEELDVRRHGGRLNGREVDADHACGGVRFGEVDRPGAGAAADVEDGAEGGGRGAEVQAVGEALAPDEVLEFLE